MQHGRRSTDPFDRAVAECPGFAGANAVSCDLTGASALSEPSDGCFAQFVLLPIRGDENVGEGYLPASSEIESPGYRNCTSQSGPAGLRFEVSDDGGSS